MKLVHIQVGGVQITEQPNHDVQIMDRRGRQIFLDPRKDDVADLRTALMDFLKEQKSE